ncbi:cupin domain-containing protein [Brevibacillus dissolubilis]|uniref:cupin domain-containing protein n=1 Tax=Brevibacillus dissolubilis TaxID=1844116 RepID=UPI001116C6DC|nr:cupin domain-containing protein [Brevibacillus dissolubilis]
MDPKFADIHTKPENSVFKVVFFPDRIYHAQYLNATRSGRYRYNVQEVRSKHDVTVLKGEVYMDGRFLTHFMRIEYRASRLVEVAREKQRFLRDEILAWVKIHPEDGTQEEAIVKLHYCNWIKAYQVEIWESLNPPVGSKHDYMILGQMGQNGAITRVRPFSQALAEPKKIKRLELKFRENDKDQPYGYTINDPQWDNNYLRSHQEPGVDEPSSQANTIADESYGIDFQRGWFLDSNEVKPVRYRNAMMIQGENPELFPDNIIEMRWLLQRELGGSVVFFHEVTIPPGTIEGTHRHVGSEELYYIVEGQGIAYMGEGDDPATDAVDPVTGEPKYRTVETEIFAIGRRQVKELPIRPGNVIFTKSGGIHGIRNTGDKPLKFVAFLYHSN